MDALIRDLDHFLAGEPLDARPDSFGYRAAKVRPPEPAAGAAGAVFAELVVALVFYTVRLAGARRGRRRGGAHRADSAVHARLFQGGEQEAGPPRACVW